jgi:hypothetical protein
MVIRKIVMNIIMARCTTGYYIVYPKVIRKVDLLLAFANFKS